MERLDDPFDTARAERRLAKANLITAGLIASEALRTESDEGVWADEKECIDTQVSNAAGFFSLGISTGIVVTLSGAWFYSQAGNHGLTVILCILAIAAVAGNAVYRW